MRLARQIRKACARYLTTCCTTETTMSQHELDKVHAELLARRANPPASLAEARDGYDLLCKRFQPPAHCSLAASELKGVPVQVVTPPMSTRVLLYAHGGGFMVGSAEGFAGVAGTLATASSATAYVLDYRRAPEHPYPAAEDDVLTAYEALLQTHNAADVVLVGDSAGAHLIVRSLIKAKANGAPLPRCVVLLSPWVDLTLSGESVQTKASIDPFLSPEKLKASASTYLAEATHNPSTILKEDLSGLPSLMIQVGENEILLDDACRLARAAGTAGVKVTLEIWPRMFHVWHLFAPVLTEGREALVSAANFINNQDATLVMERNRLPTRNQALSTDQVENH